MIKPLLQGGALLDDIAAAGMEPEALHLWWLGQSGFLVQWQGRHLLLDPYLSDSLTTKYAATDKPHVRMTELVIAPEELPSIDVVTSSHTHTDHLDPDTLIPLMRANPKLELVIPEANREFVTDRLKMMAEAPRGLVAGACVTLAGFTIRAVPAAHPEIDKDEWGRHRHLGYIVEAGQWALYHSGDTRLFDELEVWLSQQKIDVAILPINGDDPQRRVAGNMTGAEAATLAKDIRADLVIPCHYEMFEFNTASPEEFVATAERLGQRYRVLRAGERHSLRP